jgi:hypothetical protein
LELLEEIRVTQALAKKYILENQGNVDPVNVANQALLQEIVKNKQQGVNCDVQAGNVSGKNVSFRPTTTIQ